jgi:hypothetical protein
VGEGNVDVEPVVRMRTPSHQQPLGLFPSSSHGSVGGMPAATQVRIEDHESDFSMPLARAAKPSIKKPSASAMREKLSLFTQQFERAPIQSHHAMEQMRMDELFRERALNQRLRAEFEEQQQTYKLGMASMMEQNQRLGI